MQPTEPISLADRAGETPAPDAGSQPGAEWLVDVQGVRKKYCRDFRRSLWYGIKDLASAFSLRLPAPEKLREFEFWAVDDVSFQLRRGDSLGLLGRNGAGKSTLLKMITGQRSLSAGRIATRGRIVALTELAVGFNPALTGRENAYVNAAVHGFTRSEFDAVIEEVIDFSGVREFIDSAVRTYSTGMKARLGFSVATHLNPDILVVDEVLAVGDLEFRRKCVRHILAYIRRGGSMILVAHDPYLVQSICNRCIVLDRGKLVFDGSGIEGVNFHFQLGHNRQYASIADAAERVLSEEIDDADWNLEGPGFAGLPPIPVANLVPLTDEKPVVLDRLDVLGSDGERPRTGYPAKVVIRCRSKSAMEVGWGFNFVTSDLQNSIASCTFNVERGVIHLQPGENAFICTLPNLRLNPGVYAIRGGIGEAATRSALATRGYYDPPFFFTVVNGDPTFNSNLQSQLQSLVTMEAEFATQPLTRGNP